MDGPSPLTSHGLPNGIDRFEITGPALSAADLDAELRHPLRHPADLPVARFLP